MSALFLVFALGLSVGVLVGITIRDAVDLLRASRKEKAMPNLRSLWTSHSAVLAFVLVVIANFVVGVMLVVTRESSTKYATCVAHWQQDFGTAYRARYGSSARVSNALDEVVQAVADKDAERFKLAVRNYVKLRNAQVQARDRHPLPSLPSKVCGPPKDAAR